MSQISHLKSHISSHKSQIQYLMIVLDSSAPSFCYYEAATHNRKVIPFEMLERGIEFAVNKSLGITAIYGTETLPDEHRQLLDAVAHIRILPYRDGVNFTGNDLVVLDASRDASFPYRLLEQEITHLTLAIHLSDAGKMYSFIENNHCFLRRLSVVFKGLETADECMLNDFRLALQRLRPLLFNILSKERFPEIGFATDRMFLGEMNNCNAGVTHVTLAPDGKFYICPGFYHDSVLPVGSLEDGIQIKNPQLLAYSHAPICQRCDCYQCKRCVYLNRRTTLEANTPSHQQCVASHHERNLSGWVLRKFQNQGMMEDLPEIPPLFYLDPMENIDG